MIVEPSEIQTLLQLAERALTSTEANHWTAAQLETLHLLLNDAVEYVEDLLDVLKPGH